MPGKELILASGSPQRKRILEQLKIPFKAVPSQVKEDWGNLKSPAVIAKQLALRKAREVAAKYRKFWVLGVDTLVVLSNGQISGKPRNKKEAKATLKTYTGAHCDVYSGIVLINRFLGQELVRYEKARLYFRKFTDREIDTYLAHHFWQGSSGAMTIEGVGGRWVKRLKGDYWNVVGLPIVTLKRLLKKTGN